MIQLEIPDVERAINRPFATWAGDCHRVSLAIVRSGIIGEPARVARGGAADYAGQHSWIVVGDDCYDQEATLIDPTIWSFQKNVEGIWQGTYGDELQFPHGNRSIWDWGRPDKPSGPIIELSPAQPFSIAARAFLNVLGPLDFEGWDLLAQAPALEWPAGEIFAAIDNTKGLGHSVPIDMLGMLTDLNPGGLYW